MDCGIVSFHYISSINNISDVNTKIQPKFTWDGLSRLLVGASPKFIPGTNINVRFAKQLAQQERAEEKIRAKDLRTESDGRSADASIEAAHTKQSRSRTKDTSYRDIPVRRNSEGVIQYQRTNIVIGRANLVITVPAMAIRRLTIASSKRSAIDESSPT